MLSPQLHANAFAILTSPRAPFYYPAVPFFLCMLSCVTYLCYLQTIPTAVYPWKKEERAQIDAQKEKQKKDKAQDSGTKGVAARS